MSRGGGPGAILKREKNARMRPLDHRYNGFGIFLKMEYVLLLKSE